MRFFIILFSVLLAACGKSVTPDDAVFVAPQDCENVYVILPANYIIDLTAGSEIYLNPSRQEFQIFCKQDHAKKALELARKEERIPKKSDWRLYILEGTMAELGKYCHEGEICLDAIAKVYDWVEEQYKLTDFY